MSDTVDRIKQAAERELDKIGYDGYRFEGYSLYQQPSGTRTKLHCAEYTVTDGTVQVFLKTTSLNVKEVLTPSQGFTPYLESFKYVSRDPSDSLPEQDDTTDSLGSDEIWRHMQAN